MKYSVSCPEGDGVLTVDASTEEEAVTMLVEKAKQHWTEAHADKPMQDDAAVMEMVKANMKKEEAAAM